MDSKEIMHWRGEIADRAINIELAVDLIITQYYCGAIKTNFLTQVLYDPYCNLGLKTNILKKILDHEGKDARIVEAVRRLSKIRNHFVHNRLSFQEYLDKNDLTKGVRDRMLNPEKLSEEINLKELYEEFMRDCPQVEKLLMENYVSFSGVKYTEEERRALEKKFMEDKASGNIG